MYPRSSRIKHSRTTRNHRGQCWAVNPDEKNTRRRKRTMFFFFGRDEPVSVDIRLVWNSKHVAGRRHRQVQTEQPDGDRKATECDWMKTKNKWRSVYRLPLVVGLLPQRLSKQEGYLGVCGQRWSELQKHMHHLITTVSLNEPINAP